MHGLIVPVLLSDHSPRWTCGLPTTAFRASTKPALSLPYRAGTRVGRVTPEIAGAPWLVGGEGGASLPVNCGTHSPAHVGRGLLGLLEPF